MNPTEIKFKDYPTFTPNLTPYQIMKMGAFGGTYWRPIYSTITNKYYKNKHKKYNWDLPDDLLCLENCNKLINKYKVKSGTSLDYWESKNWITKYDPYGQFQWYCNFYNGRRTLDDERQIKRWEGVAGVNGRFRKRLINLINNKKSKYNDYSISPKIRQLLLQWGYELTESDFKK
jgi:hypothetical protein